ncbi:hypothetical protein Taro_046550 [Colocasia esculenta]|uniref:CAAX prenyl protease 2/Lysostaphin resistance protein A-like domain-containing protein n=1 Tax=Colocasia esculenta TaxID=4460 RepID=A0A843X6A2_COLES|nr:hypothetical protein [Colocasia esculenta]
MSCDILNSWPSRSLQAEAPLASVGPKIRRPPPASILHKECEATDTKRSCRTAAVAAVVRLSNFNRRPPPASILHKEREATDTKRSCRTAAVAAVVRLSNFNCLLAVLSLCVRVCVRARRMSRLNLNTSPFTRLAAALRMITVTALRLDALTCLNSHSVVSLEGETCNTIFLSRFNHPKRMQTRSGYKFKGFASRSSKKRSSKEQKTSKSGNSLEASSEDQGKFTDGFPPRDASYSDLSNTSSDAKSPVSSPSRSAVLQACTLTSGLILALGVFIRQITSNKLTKTNYLSWAVATKLQFPGVKLRHLTRDQRQPNAKNPTYTVWHSNNRMVILWLLNSVIPAIQLTILLHFEIWHLELIAALVILISSCRYILLKTWPDFAESSEAANQQVLSSLEPIDYMVVAFLPGISEELLFRGGLLPLFGLNWISALVVAAIFGFLHIGGGRKYSFAAWWGNVCWVCLRSGNNNNLKHDSTDGFSFTEQPYWRHSMALRVHLT